MKPYKLIVSLLLSLSILPYLLLLREIDFTLVGNGNPSFNMNVYYTIGRILGLAGFSALFLQFVLGIRHVNKFLSKDFLYFNSVHQKIGKYVLWIIFLHPVFLMLGLNEDLNWLIGFDFSNQYEVFRQFGHVAYLLIGVVWILSAILRSTLRFRPWKYTHLLVYPSVWMVGVHSFQIGSDTQVGLIGVIWMIIIPLVYVAILVRLFAWAGVGKSKYEMISHKQVGTSTYKFVFKPLGKHILPKPGQFIYLQLKRFGEAHPFTVMDYDEKSGELTFGIKKEGKFTRALVHSKIGQEAYIDGPYGVFTQEAWNSDPKVIIAGGIGITPFVRFLREHGDKNTIVIHSVRNLNEAMYRDEIIMNVGKYANAVSKQVTRTDHTYIGRLNIEILEEILTGVDLKNTKFFVCSSKGFLKAALEMVDELGVPSKNVYNEEFGL